MDRQIKYTGFGDQVERKCHSPAPGWKCMTHCQALQGFPDTNQASLNKIISCRYAGMRQLCSTFLKVNTHCMHLGAKLQVLLQPWADNYFSILECITLCVPY